MEKEELKRGFYRVHSYNGPLIYFTGKYNETNIPIFESQKQMLSAALISDSFIEELRKVDKAEIDQIIEDNKSEIRWLEEKLKDNSSL